jgi:hypothetical protein
MRLEKGLERSASRKRNPNCENRAGAAKRSEVSRAGSRIGAELECGWLKKIATREGMESVMLLLTRFSANKQQQQQQQQKIGGFF